MSLGLRAGRTLAAALALPLLAPALRPAPLGAQQIDTVVIRSEEIFPAAEAGGFLTRAANALHARTRSWVVRSEVLLEAGSPWDSALAEETERNLRRRGLFREVEVDSQRVDGRLAAVVRTVDAWSLLPRLEAQVAANGTLTGAVGGTETNLAGTGNLARLWYVRDVDRDGVVLAAGAPRLAASPVTLGGSFQDLSDRRAGSWAGGVPFRALSDRSSLFLSGEAFEGRVLAFRSESAAPPDTARRHRRALIHRLDLAAAPVASPDGYLRVGLTAEVRRESFTGPLGPGAELAPPAGDTIYGLVGGWVELRRSSFRALRHLNGFAEEDQDLSRVAFLGVKLAPGGWGYRRTGVGVRARLAAGGEAGSGRGARPGPRLLAKLVADAGGLFHGSGLDSGRVVLRGTAAIVPAARHATFLAVSGGLQEDPPPGGEIDLGFRVPPRLWHPHAFTGTRSAAVTLEHRWYAWDGPSEVLGLGLFAFVDYGGAWFADQAARFGGNAGGGALLGWPLRAGPILTQLALGRRFGGGLSEAGRSRWAASLGTGIIF